MSHPLTDDEIEIADGLMLSDLVTADDFDRALLTVTRDIGRIEEQLADEFDQDMQWRRAAESALRFKKALAPLLRSRAAAARRNARVEAGKTKATILVAQFKADWPSMFESSVSRAMAAHPDLWSDR